MDGLLIIDKPEGLTSHDVVARVRRVLGTRRVGHTGTLDPFATGVMVLLIGSATRLARFLDKDTKEYIADVRFGFETDTGDRTGTRKADGGSGIAVDAVDLERALAKFRGETMQTPPMYSAKKISGTKLYELARKGVSVERKAVNISINELEMVTDEGSIPESVFRIRVVCSAGTYIRTLAEDIGRELGVGAHLSALRRIAAGKFTIAQSISLDELKDLRDPASALLPMEEALTHLPSYAIPSERIEKTRSGLSTRVHDLNLHDGEFVRMVGGGDGLIAIGVYEQAEKSIRPKIVLI